MESAFSQKYPEILDRIDDLRWLHNIQTGGQVRESQTQDALHCWEFANPNTGDGIVLADAPPDLQDLAQSLIVIRSGSEPFDVEVDGEAQALQQLTSVIDVKGVARFWEPGSPSHYGVLDSGWLSSFIDKQISSGLVASGDSQVISPEDYYELLPSPGIAAFTMAAAELSRADIRFAAPAAYLKGGLGLPHTVEGSFAHRYRMRVREDENVFDESGFDRVFQVDLVARYAGLLIRPLANTEDEQVVGSHFVFNVHREGVVLRYTVLGPDGAEEDRIAYPYMGEEDLHRLFNDAAPYTQPKA